MAMDFRDTKYWSLMTTEEKENYMYLLHKWNQAQSDLEFAIIGKTDVNPWGMGRLCDFQSRAYSDLLEYEKTLLLKYRV